MSITRFCKRKCGIKKLFLFTFVCCIGAYTVTVIQRAKGARTVWDVPGYFNTTDGHCGATCGHGQKSFYIKTGVGRGHGPMICFQKKVLISTALGNFNRGLNVVIIDDKTFNVEFVKTYDTYVDDNDFRRDMKGLVKEGHIALMASFDEVSENLKDEGHRWLKLFGSELIDLITFRDSFLLIGQKGLKQGHAIEFIEARGDKPYAAPLEKTGCLSVPLGPVLPIASVLPLILSASKVKLGRALENCGLPKSCPTHHLAVMVSTGKDSTVLPEICVNGYMVMDGQLNNAGRGMNLVIIDGSTALCKATARFDTYEKESENMDAFLAQLDYGDLVLAMAHDDASRKLSSTSKEMLNKLGSGVIQNLKFRDVWYFVGQMGIAGFTHIEQISYAGMDAEWPTPLNDSFCVPKKIEGRKVIADPLPHRNDARRDFCKKYDAYPEFCDPTHVDVPMLTPAQLIDAKQKVNPVYSSPIVIIAGMNQNALVRTMETTVMQPGVKLENIIVSWDVKFPEYAELADLFGFKNISIPSSTSYTDLMMKSMEMIASMFQTASYLIVLEEELVLSPDFMLFLAQCSQALEVDETLIGVSAFNYNGFENTSSNNGLIYRVEEFPGLGFMLKMSVYKQRIKDNLKSCCNVRAWLSWSLPPSNNSEENDMLVPDVSRVYRFPYEGVGEDEQYLSTLFNRPRNTNMNENTELLNMDKLMKPLYENQIEKYISKAEQLDIHDNTCSTSDRKIMLKLQQSDRNYVLFYNQTRYNDYSVLVNLCQCFGLAASQSHPPKNMYKGILRFMHEGNNIMLVGSQSIFSHLKPKDFKLDGV